MKRCVFLTAVWVWVCSPIAAACTAFQFETNGRVLVGNNFDYFDGGGFLFVNPTGVSKTALVFGPDVPMMWTSKYGSVTFNPFGRENPISGMNEKGLVLAVLWLGDTRYPEPDSRFAVGELNWMQYHLDCCETVEEVLRSDAFLRIHRAAVGRIHFFAADATGDVAVIEFLDGKQVVHRGKSLPHRVVTNDTYERSLEIYRTRPLGEGCYNRPMQHPNQDRFEVALRMLEDYPPADPNETGVEYGYKILGRVAFTDPSIPILTRWSMIYDVTDRVIRFKTRPQQAVKTIDLKTLSYDCGEPLKISPVDVAEGGSMAGRWQGYDREAILAQVRATIKAAWMTDGRVSDEMLEMVFTRPELFPCTNGK